MTMMARVSNVGMYDLEWFKDEFGAKRQIEIAPKLKSATGHAKAKIVGVNKFLGIQPKRQSDSRYL